MFSENTKEVAVKRLFDFVQPPTTEGILRALQFSLPSGIGEDELIQKNHVDSKIYPTLKRRNFVNGYLTEETLKAVTKILWMIILRCSLAL